MHYYRASTQTRSKREHILEQMGYKRMPQFYEFFAGGGMARAGLGSDWHCLFANDFDEMKAATYRANWLGNELVVGDVNDLTTADLPSVADLAWASFPCQDLSLAGNYAGLGEADVALQTRSGAFWGFWKLMIGLKREERAPSVIVLENVYGILTAKQGRDFANIGRCLSYAGYKFGALLVDAIHFVPQSRPRVFIVAVRRELRIPVELTSREPQMPWHPPALVKASELLDPPAKESWIWWKMPKPSVNRRAKLEQIIGDDASGVEWHSPAETARLISMMSDRNRAKLDKMRQAGKRVVGTIYKRTRQGVQRAELRCDGIAGCLRTPAGGSSRQLVIIVNGEQVRSRLLSPREAARLMGLPDTYKLPANYNDAYHVAGDGLVVPAVRHLASSLIEPLINSNSHCVDLGMAAE